jgi:hypothetical protein
MQFSVILEDEPTVVPPFLGLFPAKPETRRTETIEANDIEVAWEQARRKWYINNADSKVQIVDIVAAEQQKEEQEEKEE